MPRRLYVGPGLPKDLTVSENCEQQLLEVPLSRTPDGLTGFLSAAILLQERELEDHFYKFGKLSSIWIARNPPGFAYIVS